MSGLGAPAGTPELDLATRRWLHDKYERLAAEEGQLAASRTSYFAAIGTVLITALVVSLNYFGAERVDLEEVVTFLSGLGILISGVWLTLLHRTVDAQNLWRQCAIHLEQLAPPIPAMLAVDVRLRTGELLSIDLFRPYLAHQARFSDDRRISWMDRANPDLLSEALPGAFVVIWVGVLAAVWLHPYF